MYATGSASNVSAVLQALATFAASAAWTIDQSAATGTGSVDWILQMHNTVGSYIQMYAHEASGANQYKIEVFGGTAIASSTTLTNQSTSCLCGLNAGPFTAYHFFAETTNSSYLHILVEISTGLFGDIFCGQLNAVGGASPAIYIANSDWSYGGTFQSYYDVGTGFNNNLPFHDGSVDQVCGATVDGTLRWFVPFQTASAPGRMKMPLYSSQGYLYDAIVRTPNTFNEVTPLHPVHYFLERGTGGVFSYVGSVPDLRLLNIQNFAAKDEITIGSDTWKIFPLIQKSLPWNINNAPASSGPYAVALLKSA